MEKNQNDHSNQHTDSKSNQHLTPDSTQKKSTTPDNPTAGHNKDQGSQHGNQQHQDSNSYKKNTGVQNTDKKEHKETDQSTKKGNI